MKSSFLVFLCDICQPINCRLKKNFKLQRLQLINLPEYTLSQFAINAKQLLVKKIIYCIPR